MPSATGAGAPSADHQDTGGPALSPTALPPGPAYPVSGSGSFTVVPGESAVVGSGSVRTYQVLVEDGMNIDPRGFADAVQATLGDPRGWGHGGGMAFQRVSSGGWDFRVELVSSATIRRICGYTLKVETSCEIGNQAYINAARWVRGAVAYRGHLAAYRHYVINHEVGHTLGYHHMGCPSPGALAPVMMEQTLGVVTDGRRCAINPWPYVGGKFVTGPAVQGY